MLKGLNKIKVYSTVSHIFVVSDQIVLGCGSTNRDSECAVSMGAVLVAMVVRLPFLMVGLRIPKTLWIPMYFPLSLHIYMYEDSVRNSNY